MDDSAELAAAAFLIAILLAFAGLYAWSVSWVIRDSRNRGRPGWAIPVVLLFGPWGALAWLAVRPSEKMIQRQVRDYRNADDAFLAASQLDTDGEWDAAIALYEYGAEQWPEHQEYAENSIAQIRRKQA